MEERFLVSRLSSLGDVICTLPVASALKQSFPECAISWVVDPRFSAIVENCRSVDHVLPAKPNFSPSSWPRFEGQFDAVLEMQGLLKSVLAVINAKTDRRLGYHWQREGSRFFSQRVLPDPTSFHIVDQYLDVARALGTSEGPAQFNLKPSPSALASIRGKLGESEDPPLIVLNAGAAWASKRWPTERAAELIKQLSNRQLLAVLIGASAADRAISQELQAQGAQFLDLVGQTNLHELVALVSLAKAHIGGDTGSTHLAAALGVPAIGLYSVTRLERSCPYGQRNRCLYDPVSLANIRSSDVLDKVLEALAMPMASSGDC